MRTRLVLFCAVKLVLFLTLAGTGRCSAVDDSERDQRLHLTFPKNYLLNANTDVSSKVAYAKTLLLLSQRDKTPSSQEISEYYEAQKKEFQAASMQDRTKSVVNLLLAAGQTAATVGSIGAGGPLVASKVLIGSPSLLAGYKTIIESMQGISSVSEAEWNQRIAELINRNLGVLLIAGLDNPKAQERLAKYILTNTIDPSNKQVDIALKNQPVTEADLEFFGIPKGPLGVLVDKLSEDVKQHLKKRESLTNDEAAAAQKLKEVAQRAMRIQEAMASGNRLTEQAKQQAMRDVELVISTLRDIGRLVHLSPSDSAQLNRFLNLAQHSAAGALELAAKEPNAFAVGASAAAILSDIFGSDAEGPNPFQAIFDKLVSIEKDIAALRNQVEELRQSMEENFQQLRAMLDDLSYQVRSTREVILRELDTLLADVRGISENKLADDWSDFEEAAEAYNKGYPYQSDSISESTREDRLRSTFQKVLNHIAPGKGGLGAQVQAGPENCIDRVLDRIRKQKERFETEASLISAAIESPDYAGKAYCIGAVARELLSNMSRDFSVTDVPMDVALFLPGDIDSDLVFKPFAAQQYVVGSPLALALFMQRIRPNLESIKDPKLRSNLIALLLQRTAPTIQSFSLLSGPVPGELLIESYFGLAHKLSDNIDELLFNKYFKIISRNYSPVIRESVQQFGSTNALHSALYPYPSNLASPFPLPYDTSRLTDLMKKFLADQFQLMANRNGEIRAFEMKSLNAVNNARLGTFVKIGKTVPESVKNFQLTITPEDVHPGWQRQIVSSNFGSAFTDSVPSERMSAQDILLRSSDSFASVMFNAEKQVFNCSWYSHPDDRSRAEGHTSVPMESVAKVSEGCRKLKIESPDRLQALPANYARLLGAFSNAYSDGFDKLERGLDDYLRFGGDSGVGTSTIADRENEIILRALSLRVVELIIVARRQRAIALASKDRDAKQVPKRKAVVPNIPLTITKEARPIIDLILLHLEAVDHANSSGQSYYLPEAILPRPRVEFPEKPSMLDVQVYAFEQVFERGQYSNSYNRVQTKIPDWKAAFKEPLDLEKGNHIRRKFSVSMRKNYAKRMANDAFFSASLQTGVQACADIYNELKSTLQGTLLEIASARQATKSE